MKNALSAANRAKRRAVSALAAFALGATALVALPGTAFAADNTVTLTPSTVEPGGTITVNGTGFDQRTNADPFFGIKLDDGGTAFTSPQPAGEVSNGTLYVKDAKYLPVSSDSFSFQITVPDTISVGEHNVRLLGGQDGGPVVSVAAKFTVVEKGSLAATTGGITVDSVSTGTDGSVSVAVVGNKLSANATVTAKIKDATDNLSWQAGRGTAESATVGEDGSLSGTVKLAAGTAPAPGPYTIVFTAGTATYEVSVSTSAGLSATDGTAAASTTGFKVVNLPEGAKVTSISAGDTKLWEGTAEAKEGTATIEDVAIAKTVASGTAITAVATTKDGKAITVASTLEVTPDNSTYGTELFTVTTAAEGVVPQGLYQSALNPETNQLFATTAVGRPPVKESALLKLNGDTLELLQKVDAPLVNEEAAESDSDYGSRYAVYGIGLDNQRGLVWVTNTRQNTVSLYKQEDLSLVNTWPQGSVNHPRDVRVDETTGKAYVSGSGENLTVFDASVTDKAAGTIAVGDATHTFGTVMSLDIDESTGKIYTVALNSATAASIDVRNGGTVAYFDLGDHVSRASGVAYDPVNKRIFVASQGTNNVVVVDETTNKILADIPTGAQALNVAYNPYNSYVYVSNRTGGTVTVIDSNTLKSVANLTAGTNTNHVSIGNNGVAYAVDKGNPNQIFRIAPVAVATTTDEGTTTTKDEATTTTTTATEQPVAEETKTATDSTVTSTNTDKTTKADTKKASSSKKSLAKTGAALTLPLALAVLLMGAGTVITVRRRQQQD